ncbi:MAG: hypothetical protein ABRQ39_00375 [Candidatus Eremiobacterota bacterium]
MAGMELDVRFELLCHHCLHSVEQAGVKNHLLPVSFRVMVDLF